MKRPPHTSVVVVAWINVMVAAIIPLMLLAQDRGLQWGDLWRSWAYALVYANVAGVPAVFLGRRLVEALVLRRVPLVAAVLLGTLFFAAAGALLAQTFFTVSGIASARRFWPEYFQTLRAAALLSIGCGLGALFYESARERLRDTEERLHAKEVAEERALKLAAEARLRALESRLHPHFFFNTLNSISALIPVDPARAEHVVGRLAGLLRSSLDYAGQPLIPLEQELSIVQDYVDIESVRFGDKLRSRVDVAPALRALRVPPLSVQSLVENAVKHGITPLRGGGQVQVTATADDGRLRVTVADSGPGFDLAAIPAGRGLDNLVARLDALFDGQAHLDVSRRDGRCVVEMVLPRS